MHARTEEAEEEQEQGQEARPKSAQDQIGTERGAPEQQATHNTHLIYTRCLMIV
jgi:hypothetical protein